MRCRLLSGEIITLLNVCGPVNSVPERLAAAEKHGEGPEPLVRPEDLLQIKCLADVVGAAVGLALLIQVLNRRLIRCR